MRLGILFPVAIFIVAVVFLGWFFVGGYAAPGGRNEKSTIIMLIVAIVAVAGTQFGWW
jgi:cation transport ATPase